MQVASSGVNMSGLNLGHYYRRQAATKYEWAKCRMVESTAMEILEKHGWMSTNSFCV
jgi:hypothetical protein